MVFIFAVKHLEYQPGEQSQADINGAINIGITPICSLDEAALDQWLTNPFFARKYPEKNVRAAGRKPSCTWKASSTSSLSNGNETTSSSEVSVIPGQTSNPWTMGPPSLRSMVEPVNREPQHKRNQFM